MEHAIFRVFFRMSWNESNRLGSYKPRPKTSVLCHCFDNIISDITWPLGIFFMIHDKNNVYFYEKSTLFCGGWMTPVAIWECLFLFFIHYTFYGNYSHVQDSTSFTYGPRHHMLVFRHLGGKWVTSIFPFCFWTKGYIKRCVSHI